MSDGSSDSQLMRQRPIHSDERGFDTLPYRLRLVLWPDHQPPIAFFIATCLTAMVLFFVYLAVVSDGIVDIDQASPRTAKFQVDINSAECGEIVILPGIGDKLAQSIVNYRSRHGAFKSISGLEQVSGIGPKKVQNLTPFIVPIGKTDLE